MLIATAREELNRAIKRYPSLMPEIMSAWELTRDEIDSGEPEDLEAEHFMSWLKDRVEEHTND